MDWLRLGPSLRHDRVRHPPVRILPSSLTLAPSSIGPVFRELHGFSTNAIGLVFLTLSIGALVGFAGALYQERLYAHKAAARGPEARLYLACAAALVFPAGMFIYAWCAFASVPWIGLCVGVVVRSSPSL
jgi:hypothetical protein